MCFNGQRNGEKMKDLLSLSYEKRRELVPHPYAILGDDSGVCDTCDNTRECPECEGKGVIDHHCSCEYCSAVYIECPDCINGRCPDCEDKES